MRQDLLKNFKELKEIRPEADYFKRSRVLILAEIEASKKYVRVGFFARKFVWGVAIAAVLLLVISGGTYSYIKNQSDQNDLVAKASEANASIQVKLNEIQYLIKNQNQNGIGLNINQVLTIQVLLQKASEDLKAAVSSNSQDLNQSFEKIKQVQEMLYQMDLSAGN